MKKRAINITWGMLWIGSITGVCTGVHASVCVTGARRCGPVWVPERVYMGTHHPQKVRKMSKM